MGKLILETPRLTLREITMDDFTPWHRILSDPETMQYYPSPFSEEKTKSWIDWSIDNYQKYGFGLWAVLLKDSDQWIGDCGITMQNIYHDGRLFPEIGYHIDKQFWNMGYASEAAKACLQFIFKNTDYDEVFCYQKWTNLPSRRVAEKMGMFLRKEYADEKNGKTSVYSITRAGWDSSFPE
ncbi:MAG: GNAT family N-acetyltransferase [Eubacteriales bacterium]|nr:GNAT family N-acetyltransferase [Eubacteriales bacterium]